MLPRVPRTNGASRQLQDGGNASTCSTTSRVWAPSWTAASAAAIHMRSSYRCAPTQQPPGGSTVRAGQGSSTQLQRVYHVMRRAALSLLAANAPRATAGSTAALCVRTCGRTLCTRSASCEQKQVGAACVPPLTELPGCWCGCVRTHATHDCEGRRHVRLSVSATVHVLFHLPCAHLGHLGRSATASSP